MSVLTVYPFTQWSIKLHGGSSEALQQYKVNLTAIVGQLEKLAEHGEVYWVLQGVLSFSHSHNTRSFYDHRQASKVRGMTGKY